MALSNQSFSIGKRRLIPGFMFKRGTKTADLALYENAAALVEVSMARGGQRAGDIPLGRRRVRLSVHVRSGVPARMASPSIRLGRRAGHVSSCKAPSMREIRPAHDKRRAARPAGPSACDGRGDVMSYNLDRAEQVLQSTTAGSRNSETSFLQGLLQEIDPDAPFGMSPAQLFQDFLRRGHASERMRRLPGHRGAPLRAARSAASSRRRDAARHAGGRLHRPCDGARLERSADSIRAGRGRHHRREHGAGTVRHSHRGRAVPARPLPALRPPLAGRPRSRAAQQPDPAPKLFPSRILTRTSRQRRSRDSTSRRPRLPRRGIRVSSPFAISVSLDGQGYAPKARERGLAWQRGAHFRRSRPYRGARRVESQGVSVRYIRWM